ncbi:MAG: GAF domain-containing protein [Candidatus Izemoplasmataceae bacterium]
MFTAIPKKDTKEENYQLILEYLPHTLSKNDHIISNLANMSALLNYFINGINWVGFYLEEDKELYLGPFQGNVACSKITIGQGVCGTSYQNNETVVVEDVNAFPGHIACDAASQSEIVIPFKTDTLSGVLDIDSPLINHFDAVDQAYLEKAVEILKTFLK